jgi:hypothetical protein
MARELRKIRLSQPKQTTEQAREQCRRIERAAIDDVMKTDTIYLNDMVYFTYTQQDRIEAIWFLEEKVFREWIGTYERWYFDVMSEKEEKK